MLSVVLMLNSMIVESPFIGVPVSLLLLYVGSVAIGEMFFSREKSFLRHVLGFATFVLLLALCGVALILTARFTKMLSLLLVVVIGLVFCFLSSRRGGAREEGVFEKLESDTGRTVTGYLLVCLFLFWAAASFYALVLGRTGEGVSSVWLTIPSLFLPAFFLSSVFLVFVLFFTRVGIGWKLVLVCVYSFLVHSLFLVVWYPGRYGDPWTHLGAARYINMAGRPYAYDWLLRQSLIVDLIKYKTQYALIVFFQRMFCIDIYWVHIVFIPLMWSIFMPLISYKIATLLTKKESKAFPFLAAVATGLFPSLILWGAVSVPNSLGFIFFLLSILLLLYWVDTGKRRFWFLSLFASVATFLAHPQTGIFALIFLFWVIVIQGRLPNVFKLFSSPVFFALYPIALYLNKATFFPMELLKLENFLSFQGDLTTLLLVFSFVGLLFSIMDKRVKTRSAILLFLFYVTIIVDYYVSMYGMKNLPFGPGRILAMADLLSVPFVALGLWGIMSVLEKAFSRVKVKLLRNVKIGLNPRVVSMLLICVFLSSQTTFTLYQAYPHDEILDVQPAAYEIEAISYISSNSTDRFVAVCEPAFASLATGFLGSDYTYGANPRGMVGVPEWDWWTVKLYSQMCKTPSVDIMKNAIDHAGAKVSYYVVSVRNPDFYDVVQRVSAVLPVDKVFGDGKLYVFRYPYALPPVVEGVGPTVKLVFDDGPLTEYVQTRFRCWYKSEVNYTVTLSGHSSYNITEYHKHWTFLSLTVDGTDAPFDESTDVNILIYVAGLDPDNVLEVTWRANDNYPIAEWKEDSFKSGWRTHPLYTGTITPEITTDGNILELSWDFTTGEYQYHYYVKSCDITTGENQSVIVRWRSTAPIAVVYVYYEDGGQEIVPLGSESTEWTTTIVQLSPRKSITSVMVGMTNLNDKTVSGIQTLHMDYILICSKG